MLYIKRRSQWDDQVSNRASCNWVGRPPRRSIQELNEESDSDDLVQYLGDLPRDFPQMSQRWRRSSRKCKSSRELPNPGLTQKSPEVDFGCNFIAQEIKFVQNTLSQELAEEADELKQMIKGLRDSLQIVHEDVARLREEQSATFREPRSHSQKSRALSVQTASSFRCKTHSRASVDAPGMCSSVQDLPDVAVSEVLAQENSHCAIYTSCSAEGPGFDEKVVMNGVSEISRIPRRGQDDPLDWSSLSDTERRLVERRRTSFTHNFSLSRDTNDDTTSSSISSNGLSSPQKNTLSARTSVVNLFSHNRTGLNRQRSNIVGLDLQAIATGETGKSYVSAIFAHRNSTNTKHILFPDSPTRNAWDICSLVVVIFDCITIPYNIAWKPQNESTFMVYGTWVTMAFWSMDMILTCNTAYYVGGDLETRRSLILKNYLKTSFIFDALATGCDWMMAILQFVPDAHLVSLLRYVKTQRALRVARFLRVSHMWSRLEQLNAMFVSDAWHMVSQVVTMLVALLLVNHLICCFWYAIGTQASDDTGMTWLDTTEQVEDAKTTYRDYNDLYQYVTSYHWSVVQMFVGSTQVNAMNSLERIFNIFCNLFGMFFTAGITSWFSALLVRYQQQRNEFESVMKSVRRYLRLNKVDASISARVQKLLSMRLSARKRETENDIDAFKLLSKVLRAELRRDVAKDVLFVNPMIMLLDRLDRSISLNLALNFECVELVPGEDLFDANKPLDKSFGILQGRLTYKFLGCQGSEKAGDPSLGRDIESGYWSGYGGLDLDIDGSGLLCENDWIAEAAIWVRDWLTRGLMECCKEAELISIDGTRFQLACSRYGKIQALISAYAKSYADLLKHQCEFELNDITPPVDHPVVLMNMDIRSRVVAAEPVLLQLRSEERGVFSLKSRPKKGVDVLENEVKNGECGLMIDRCGNASRIAFVVLVRAERSDGLVLVQVAKFSDGHVTSKLQMPATKIKDGEHVTDAAERIIKKNLAQFGGAQSKGKHTQDVFVKSTEGYGMDTLFYRTEILVPFEKSDITPPVINYSDLVTRTHISFLPKQLSRSKFEAANPLADSLPAELYFVRSGPASGTVYAWMSDATFALLGEPEHHKTLDDYVACLEIPATVEKDLGSGQHILVDF